jgi:dihydrofolate synthase/folylpolyglutamate synthase
VINPLISVITDVSLDHQKFLGNTIREIAHEKAGIIRAGGVVVTLPQHPEANDVIGNTILECHAKGVSAVPYVPPVSPGATRYRVTDAQRRAMGSERPVPRAKLPGHSNGYPLSVMGEEIQVETPLIGRHQLRNIALAIAAAVELNVQGFEIKPAQIDRGIRETQWPGRFQVIPPTAISPEFVLDAAHNPAGAWALRSALSERYGERPFTLIFGAMRDKAVGEMAEILFPVAEHVIATRAENPRSALAEEICLAASRTSAEIVCAKDVGAAIEKVRTLAGQNGLVVIAGSIYVVGEAMRELGVSA